MTTNALIRMLPLATLLAAGPALAHHPTGGEVPQTLWHGFASGLGHPVIGVDHLAFVLALGLLAAVAGVRGALAPALFIGATVLGALLHAGGIHLPISEIVIALSVLAAGLVLVVQARPSGTALGLFAALAGLFHGFGYGETIVGAQTQPLLAYLVGFALIQAAICALAYRGSVALYGRALRYAGAAIGAVGVVALAFALLA